MLFFITDASGSGKTTCFKYLRKSLPQIYWYDFDAVGVPTNAGTIWRQHTTEHWIQKAVQHQFAGKDTGVCGQAVYGEILACPSAIYVNGIAVCLLDCHDVVRINRLKIRGKRGVSQDTLCWASWLRMHAIDPQWRQDIIRDEAEQWLHWKRWGKWQEGDSRWRLWVLDTTNLSIDEMVKCVTSWVLQQKDEHLNGNSSLQKKWWENE